MNQLPASSPAGITDLNFKLLINSWQLHAAAYKTAADKIADAALQDRDSTAHGDLLFPAVYLYRHYLELMLKNLLHGGIALQKITVPAIVLKRHNLKDLWTHTAVLLSGICDSAEQAQIAAAERLVLEYHAVDESSCAFRYPEQHDGSTYLTSLPSNNALADQLRAMDLRGPRTAIGEVHEFLYEIGDEMNAEFDGIKEQNMP